MSLFGTIKTAKEIGNLYLKGHPHAKNIWDGFGDNLGKCLSHPCNLLDPEVIVIGGGISLAFDYYKDKLIGSLEENSIVYRHSKLDIIPRKNWMNSFYYGAINL